MKRVGKSSLGSVRVGDRDTINTFIAYLEEKYSISSSNVIFPDDQNRCTPDVDAIVGGIAIEHTSIDSIKGQRENNAKFQLVFVPTMEEFSPLVDAHYWMVVSFKDVQAIKKPAEAAKIVRAWFNDQVVPLPEGRYHQVKIPTVNISVNISKSTDLWSTVIFLRSAEPDKEIEVTLKNRLLQKASKLKNYKERGLKTCLIVESEDIAFMSDHIFKETYKKAFGNSSPDNVDAVFFANSANHQEPPQFSLICGTISPEIIEANGQEKIASYKR